MRDPAEGEGFSDVAQLISRLAKEGGRRGNADEAVAEALGEALAVGHGLQAAGDAALDARPGEDLTDLWSRKVEEMQRELSRTQALELEERFDKNIGPHTRRFIYEQFFEHGFSVAELYDQKVAIPWQKAILPAFAPLMKEVMIRDMAINPAAAEKSRAQFEAEFEFAEKRLADGRMYLCGDTLTAADITFAALSAPVILPQGYGARLPKPEDAPVGSRMRQMIEAYRARPAGQFILRLYKENRHTPIKIPAENY